MRVLGPAGGPDSRACAGKVLPSPKMTSWRSCLVSASEHLPASFYPKGDQRTKTLSRHNPALSLQTAGKSKLKREELVIQEGKELAEGAKSLGSGCPEAQCEDWL